MNPETMPLDSQLASVLSPLEPSSIFSLTFWDGKAIVALIATVFCTLLLIIARLFLANSTKKRLLKEQQKKFNNLRRIPSFENLGLEELFVQPEQRDDTLMPTEMIALCSSIKIFGYLEEPVFLELCKESQVVEVQAGDYLFRKGDKDCCLYVVVSGSVQLFIHEKVEYSGGPSPLRASKRGILLHERKRSLAMISPRLGREIAENNNKESLDHSKDSTNEKEEKEESGSEGPSYAEGVFGQLITEDASFIEDDEKMILLNEVRDGESIASFFNVLSVLVSREQEPVNVTAIAKVPTRLVKISASAFETLRNQFPKSAAHIVQVLIARFQKVTSRTINKYLGLTNDILFYGQDLDQNLIRDLKVAHLSYSAAEIKTKAAALFASHLGMPKGSESMLKDSEVKTFKANSILVKEGDRYPNVYFVIHGYLTMMTTNLSGRQKTIFDAGPGEIAGYLAALSNYPSLTTIKAQTDTRVFVISRECFERIIDKAPDVAFNLARRLLSSITPLGREIDFALDWSQINAGQPLFRQGDQSDSIYIVLHGRLRSMGEAGAVVAEVGPGESVGELEVLLETKRQSAIYAIRDTEIARLPKALLNVLASKLPAVALQISRLIANRSYKQMEQMKRKDTERNYKTVALLAVSESVPLLKVAENLGAQINKMGATILTLSSNAIASHPSKFAFTRMGQMKLVSWLEEQEENHQIVLYVSDHSTSPWTARCIRQADIILTVAMASEEPDITDMEKYLISMKTTARKELILLHPKGTSLASGTGHWLELRPWIRSHHHVRMDLRSSALKKKFSARSFLDIASLDNSFYDDELDQTFIEQNAAESRSSDFARLGRMLIGKSIGLVLGGGGARGLSQIGVIKAFQEADIPIDMVGGTSMGSYVGALYAKETDHLSIAGWARKFSSDMGSKLLQILDLTYPVVAIFTGAGFNRAIKRSFGEIQIEDLMTPYFCVTTNITSHKLSIHTSGFLWKYVRASMSLSGYLPPIWDNGSMLLDGGYINVLPGDVMKSRGANIIIAIDVGREDEKFEDPLGDSISGWALFLRRMIPFMKPPRIPTMADIQDRLAFVTSVKTMEEVKNIEGLYYLRPPVSDYGTLEFNKYDEIVKVGYKYGKELVQKWKENDTLKEWLNYQYDPATRPYHARRFSI